MTTPTARQLRRQRADGQAHGLVPASALTPYAAELIERCGSAYSARRLCGVSDVTLVVVARGKRPTVQRRTAVAILRALLVQRKSDRASGLHPRYMRHLQARARLDARVEQGPPR